MNKYLIRHCTWQDNDDISIHCVNGCFPEGSPNGITMMSPSDIWHFQKIQLIFKSNNEDPIFDEIREDSMCKGVFYMLTKADSCQMAYSKYVFRQMDKEEEDDKSD